MRLSRALGVVLVLAMGSGAALAQAPRPPSAVNCGVNGRTFVLIANGVSDLGDLPSNLDSAYDDLLVRRPILQTIGWTRSDLPWEDYRNRRARVLAGARMAFEVQKIHRCYPNSAVVLMGYCAGAHVVLVAAEQLPPGAVDRIILLSPAVSSCYDVRPALRASKLGLDNFYNSDDSVLEFYETEYGAADGGWSRLAGLTGFRIPRALYQDPIFRGLRQADVTRTAALGGHFATIVPTFLQRNVVPLIPVGQVVIVGPQGPAVPPGLPPGLPPPALPAPGPQGPAVPPGPPRMPPPPNPGTQGPSPGPFGPILDLLVPQGPVTPPPAPPNLADFPDPVPIAPPDPKLPAALPPPSR